MSVIYYKNLILFLRTLFLLFLTFFSVSPVFSIEKQADTIEKLLDEGTLKKAKVIIDDSLRKNPDFVPVLYQSARYYLKTGFLKKNSIIAYQYSNTAENTATLILEKIIKIDPNYSKAYSLLGHIYAVQNNDIEAEKQFVIAESFTPKPLWLNLNKALLAIQKQDFKQAVGLLSIDSSRNIKNFDSVKVRNIKKRVYASSWGLLKKIIAEKPEYDPIKVIRDGLIKRVNPEDLAEYLKKPVNSKKELYVHFTSSDKWCGYCLQNNLKVEKLAKEHQDKYDFIHVSFEPWDSYSSYGLTIAKPVIITALPIQIVYKHGKPVLYKRGEICDCSFEQMINGTFEKIDPDYKEKKVTDKSNVIENIEYYFNNYKAADKHYKAFAVVIDGDYWQTGISRKRLSQKLANRKALEQCENEKKKHTKTKNPCQLFGIGNKKVFGFLEGEINTITHEIMGQKLGPIDIVVKNYKKQKKEKALAIAIDPYQRWNTFYYSDSDENGCEDIDDCKVKVLNECNNNRKKWRTSTPCQIYYENNIQVKEIVFPEFK